MAIHSSYYMTMSYDEFVNEKYEGARNGSILSRMVLVNWSWTLKSAKKMGKKA